MAAINWKSGVSGDWGTAGDWAGGAIPGAADDVTIAAAGNYTVTINSAEAAHSLTINSANAKIVDNATFTLGAALSVQAGTFTLGSSGDVVGGTISTSGSGSFLSTGGTLTGTAFQGALTLGTVSNSIYLQGADTFAGAGGAGPGTITMGANGDALIAIDNFTLDNAMLNFSATNANDYLRVYSLASNTDTLTFGSHLNVVQSATGNQATIDLYSDVNTSGTFVNRGTITASAKNGGFTVYGPYGYGTFINQGTINVSNSDTFSLQTNATSSALGSFTTATGGVFKLNSGYTLSNTGATLALSSGSQLTLAGEILGGTVSDSGGGLISQAGTLSGTTYQGALALGTVSTNLFLQGADTFTGAGGTGAGSITLGANGDILYTIDNLALDNTTLTFGATNAADYVRVYSLNSNTDTLTFGSHLSVVQSSTGNQTTIDLYSDVNTSGTFINQGTITASAKGGGFTIYGPNGYGTFINQGTINVSNSDTFSLQTNVSSSALGSFTTATGGVFKLNSSYTLSNTGATLALSTGSQLTLEGDILGGTVSDTGGGLISQFGSLSGVTYQGTLNVAASSDLSIYNGLNVIAGGTAGVINVTGSGSELDFYDTQTLDNATLNFGNGTGYSSICVYEDTNSAATLTLGSHLTLAQTGAYAQIYIDQQNKGNALVNHGTITAGVHGGTLSIIGYYTGDTFTNQGSLIASNGDSIVLRTDVTTSGLGAFSTASGGAVVLSGGSTLSNAGTTLALSTGSQLTLAGEILGGTVSDTGGGLIADGGTLSGLTYQGTLNVGTNGYLVVSNGVTVASGGGAGVVNLGTNAELDVYSGLTVMNGSSAGVINDTGNDSYLYFYDTQTLDNATLSIGNNTNESYLYLYEDSGSAATLTFGSHLTLAQTGAYAQIDIDQQNKGNALVNQGTITAGVQGGTLSIYGPYAGDTFTNQGSLIASNSDSIVLQTDITTAGLGAFSTSGGGAVVLASGNTLSNTGATLALSTGSQLTLGGEILGGTVSDSGSGLVARGGTLSGVTYQGTLNIGASNYLVLSNGVTVTSVGGPSVVNIGTNAELDVYNGLNFAGSNPGVINDTGYGSQLYFFDTQTLNNATLNIGSGSSYSYIYQYEDTGSAATLTLGSHFTLAQAGTNAQIYIDQQNVGNALVNQGTITAGVQGGTLSIYGPYAGDTFTNQGSLIASNGDSIVLSTNVTTAGLGAFSTSGGGAVVLASGYTLSNTGATLALSSGSQLTLAGSIAGGTVADGGGLISLNGTLSNVAYQGTLNLSAASSQITFNGTDTFAGAGGTGMGTINLTGANATIYTDDNTTLNNALVNFGGANTTDTIYLAAVNTQNDTLTLGTNLVLSQTVAGSSDEINLYNGPTAGTLTNLGTIVAAASGGLFTVYNAGSQIASFTNAGRLAVSNSDDFLVSSVTTFTNTGGLSVGAGGTIDLSTVGTVSNLTGTTLTGGAWEADANGTLKLANNTTVVTDAASITLSGSNSLIESLNTTTNKEVLLDQKLTSIASTGTLALLAGRSLNASAAFTDNGLLQLGGYSFFTASNLTIGSGGRLAGYGQVNAPLTDNGTVEASGADLVLSGAVIGAGTLQIDAGASLDLKSSTLPGETLTYAGQGGVLFLDAPASFDSPIAGFAAGDEIYLTTLTVTSAAINGQNLAITLSSGTVLNETLLGSTVGERVGVSQNAHGITDYRFASASTLTPSPVTFADHHVGDQVSTTLTLTNTAAPDGYSEKLDAAATGGLAAGSITGLAAGGTDGTDLRITLSTASAGAISGAGTYSLSTDGAGLDGGAPVLLGTQTVAASGHVFAYAAGTLASNTVTLANVHVGATDQTLLSLTNSAAATGGYTEALDAAFAGTSGAAGASGSLLGLGAGATNATSLAVSLNTAQAGAITGGATLALTSDGAGIDSLGTTTLASQAITVSGAVYAYAAPTLSATVLNFGAARVGDSVAGQTLTLGNGAAANAYQESLDYGFVGVNGFSGSANGTLLAGGSTGLVIDLSTATAGDFSNTQDAGTFASDGNAIGDGLGTTALAGQTVTLNGKVFAAAVAQLSATTLNFGVVHVGDTGADTMLSLGLTNGAYGLLTDLLTGGLGSLSGAFTENGSLGAGLAAGQSGTLGFQIDTQNSGSLTGSALLNLFSHDSYLADLALSTGVITLEGTVDNYAVAALAETSGGGSFAQNGANYTLDLGQIVQGANPVTVGLEALNAAMGTADLLGGTLTASGSSAFSNSGLGAFSGLGAGQAYGGVEVTLSTGATGVFTETIVFTSAGSNASGYSGALPTETLTITGTVVASAGQTYTLTKTPVAITGGAGNDVFIAASNTLVKGDMLDGGGGTNTLSLVGGGTFNLAAPTTLVNIQVIDAQEGQAAGGGQASTLQTITLRAGLDAAVNVAAANLNGADPNPAAITINGAANADVITLGNSTDTVLNLGANETVYAGTGTDLIKAAIGSAGAAVVGQSTGTATLELTTGGTATLNAADTHLLVKLDAATTLHLGGMGFVTALGGKGNDTLYAGGAGQVLEGGGGKNALFGYAGGGDTFLDTTKNVATDTISGWTTGDMLDITDMNPASAHITGFKGGKLSVTDGTHKAAIAFSGSLSAGNFVVLGSDGHGGTLIGYHG